MKEKKIMILLLILFFGAACFGGGVFYGQHLLKAEGFVYTVGGDQENSGKVNLNTADKAELTAVDGIGEGTAAKIISYREEHGDFEETEDLVNEGIIGKSKWEQVKTALTVD